MQEYMWYTDLSTHAVILHPISAKGARDRTSYCAAAQVPGGRVLVLVGASHKAFFDAYLRAMMNVRVVNAEQVLRHAP